jgi:hypothetical protein
MGGAGRDTRSTCGTSERGKAPAEAEEAGAAE